MLCLQRSAARPDKIAVSWEPLMFPKLGYSSHPSAVAAGLTKSVRLQKSIVPTMSLLAHRVESLTSANLVDRGGVAQQPFRIDRRLAEDESEKLTSPFHRSN
jgi:DNA-binding HxlR family transcriptional regulator